MFEMRYWHTDWLSTTSKPLTSDNFRCSARSPESLVPDIHVDVSLTCTMQLSSSLLTPYTYTSVQLYDLHPFRDTLQTGWDSLGFSALPGLQTTLIPIHSSNHGTAVVKVWFTEDPPLQSTAPKQSSAPLQTPILAQRLLRWLTLWSQTMLQWTFIAAFTLQHVHLDPVSLSIKINKVRFWWKAGRVEVLL